ncbi:MAG: GNAT family N-acetyltransferase [Clostridia bacterium]|nr:GNAT family N-acetyltransferase [Clostridia bacterium]
MELYQGHGVAAQREALLAMLDEVFFAEDEPETQRDFLTLLPKLYKEEYAPAEHNLIVAEDGEIKAAIGLYPFEMQVAGETLRVGGIGNVAVATDARGKGYMILLMQRALEEMAADGTDYSLLGGHRQRYGYFGYEPGGQSLHFGIDRRNIAHIKGRDYQTDAVARPVTAEDADALAGIALLYNQGPMRMVRAPEALYDILCSWRSVPYVVTRGEAFVGYFVKQKFGGIQELKAADPEDLIDVCLCAMDVAGKDSVSFEVPPFDTAAADYMARHCGWSEISHAEMVCILNFKRFTQAFLRLKATHARLCDGEIVLLIHGDRGDEQLRITVQDNRVTVTETQDAPALTLDQHTATRLITSPFCKEKELLPAFAQQWFPADFFAYSQDNV